uniref:Uncharacterized protein n=1 Tax=Pavo cristatus TaxID=9049 RepID=A0A8C9FUU0_PAVCR
QSNYNVLHLGCGSPCYQYKLENKRIECSPNKKDLRVFSNVPLLLHSDRDPIPDVPAVYFVMPTEENIDRMCQVTCIPNI